MAEITQKQLKFITRENLTPKEAVSFLKSGMQIRSFQDNIKEVYPAQDVEKQLAEGMCALEERKLTVIQRESICKKVRNWMRGKNMPTDREEVFKICFALELSLEKAEKLLSRLTEQGIHYRNSREVVYAYCLKYQASYREACSMAAQLESLGNKSDHAEPMTQLLKTKFQTIKGKEDLFTFLLNEQSRMGQKHNTAYAYFMGMLSILSGEHMEGEDAYSMEYIAENYLRLNMPRDKKTAGYSNAQKIVKKYWPGTRSIKAMKVRTEDVNRKTLLLLYIATGGVWDETYQEIDETYVSADEFLEAHCKRMNHMLEACGMSPMDSRNMFDYLVLYCLRPEHTVFMSERMEALLSELFL